MLAIQWSENMKVGIVHIDRNWRQIIAMLNLAQDALEFSNIDLSMSLTHDLIKKCAIHFENEVQILSCSKYPGHMLKQYIIDNIKLLQGMYEIVNQLGKPEISSEDLSIILSKMAEFLSIRLNIDSDIREYLLSAA